MKRRISTSDIWADFCAALTSYDGGMTVEQLLNDGWQFCKLPLGSTLEDVSNAALQAVDLPHDFLIENENDLYETTDAWYLRTLDVPESWCASCVLVRFDGVYMDCDVLLNGHIVCTHHYGYTAFDVDLTSRLLVGRNTLAVHVRHQSPNSRWYSGAGIYRDVTLHVLPKRHIPLDGVYVTTTHELESWTMTIDTELCGVKDNGVLTHVLLDGDVPVCDVTVEAAGDHANAVMQVLSPKLWSPDAPNVYTLQTMLGNQVIRQNVGFRDLTFTTDCGLLVNGAPVKLHGVCLHHDLGCLGSAFHEKAMRRQLRAMRQMGVNALRTSHNPPAKQVMDLCDELGIFVVDEAFDMWLRAKTPFDYARFFPTDMPSDVAAWVRRDRNHPSLLMWSIGNVIFAANQAAELAEKEVHVIPTKNVAMGIAAAVAFQDDVSGEENAKRMAEAAEHVKTGTVTYAVRDSEYNGVQIHKGDIIGMHNGKIEYCGNSVHDVVLDMMKAVVTDDAELITVYYGADTTKEDAEQVAAEIADQYPNCDVDCLLGGQPLYYYLISVE